MNQGSQILVYIIFIEISNWHITKWQKCTVRFGNCFPRVPLMYQPCCLVPCCLGKIGDLTKSSLQNLLYTSFCLLVFHLTTATFFLLLWQSPTTYWKYFCMAHAASLRGPASSACEDVQWKSVWILLNDSSGYLLVVWLRPLLCECYCLFCCFKSCLPDCKANIPDCVMKMPHCSSPCGLQFYLVCCMHLFGQ